MQKSSPTLYIPLWTQRGRCVGSLHPWVRVEIDVDISDGLNNEDYV